MQGEGLARHLPSATAESGVATLRCRGRASPSLCCCPANSARQPLPSPRQTPSSHIHHHILNKQIHPGLGRGAWSVCTRENREENKCWTTGGRSIWVGGWLGGGTLPPSPSTCRQTPPQSGSQPLTSPCPGGSSRKAPGAGAAAA